MGRYTEVLNDTTKSVELDSANKRTYELRGETYYILSQQTDDINKRNEYYVKAVTDMEVYSSLE
jgi:hypothetical protein